MSFLNTLEKRFRRFALPHVTLYLIAGQGFVFLLYMGKAIDIGSITLIGVKVYDGEIWRLVTFLLVPPSTHPVLAFFAWYLFYLTGTALERHWGISRYNIYLLIATIAAVAVSFVAPEATASNAFIGGSVFFAFAFLNPDFTLYLFFLPVKIKWLAFLMWFPYFLIALFGSWLDRLLVLASVSNFLLFFWEDILRKVKFGRQRMIAQAQQFSEKDEAFHQCTVCSITDKTDPGMEFRYCTSCEGSRGYCTAHIMSHEHVRKEENRRAVNGLGSRGNK